MFFRQFIVLTRVCLTPLLRNIRTVNREVSNEMMHSPSYQVGHLLLDLPDLPVLLHDTLYFWGLKSYWLVGFVLAIVSGSILNGILLFLFFRHLETLLIIIYLI